MIRYPIDEIIHAVNGELVQGESTTLFSGISTDSRNIHPGELFIALKGERFDGHDYLDGVAQTGASAIMISDERPYPPGIAVIKVNDTLMALGKIASFHRQRFQIPVIGITGSNGKTTTKDLIAAVLSRELKIIKTEGNFNNEIGLPFTLFKIDELTQAAIVEMGMRGLGQIKLLADIARPTIGVVTNVGLTHLEILGSQENIAKAKVELIQALPSGGLAVLNGDDAWVRSMQTPRGVKTVFYGIDGNTLDYRASDLELLSDEVRFNVRTVNEVWPVRLPLPGRHNVLNAMAAIALALELNVSPRSILDGLAKPEMTGRRLKIIPQNDYWVIDDTYNASPTSMQAALDVLKDSGPGRKIAVLADMLELGPDGSALHREVGSYAGTIGIDRLLACGELAQEYVKGINGITEGKGEYFSNKSALCERLINMVRPGDRILVKGSRGMKMEDVVAAIVHEEVEK